MTKKIVFTDVPTLHGMQSPAEIVESIKKTGENIARDQSSCYVNTKKIESMRAELDLFSLYNFTFKMMKEKQETNDYITEEEVDDLVK